MFASQRLRDDENVVMRSIRQNGNSLKYASDRLKDDQDIVLKALKCKMGAGVNSALQHVSDRLRDDKNIVSEALKKNPNQLQYASSRLRNDKDIILLAIERDIPISGLQYTSIEIRDDKEVIENAIGQSASALEYASDRLKDDKDLVLMAISEDGDALQYASDRLKDDRQVVLAAVEPPDDDVDVAILASLQVSYPDVGCCLKYASRRLKDDKDVVAKAIAKNGRNLQFASNRWRSDKNMVLSAIERSSSSIKFALNGLNQQKDCLIAAGLWDEGYDDDEQKVTNESQSIRRPLIVMSTRFSLNEHSSTAATDYAVLLKKDRYFKEEMDFKVFSPNAFDKKSCDPDWTNFSWPCRGTVATCELLKSCGGNTTNETAATLNVPTNDSSWRYSFRCQLEEAKSANGFMLQLVEFGFEHREQNGEVRYGLGKGQTIELDMAKDIGIKVFQVHQVDTSCSNKPSWFTERDVSDFSYHVKEWYEQNCSDMSVQGFYP